MSECFDKQPTEPNKTFPIGKCVVWFGELPLTILLPPGTLLQQKQLLKQRIKHHCDSLHQTGVWESPPTEHELNEVINEITIEYAL